MQNNERIIVAVQFEIELFDFLPVLIAH